MAKETKLPYGKRFVKKTKMERPIVAAAITVFEESEHLRRCLESGNSQWDFAVVVDNGRDRETKEEIEKFSSVYRVEGNRNNWWTAGTNIAIRKCLEHECDYVLLVNADIELKHDCVRKLVSTIEPRKIVASVVLDRKRKQKIVWAGGRWHRWFKNIPVVLNRPLFKDKHIRTLPDDNYTVEDVHGRGVLFPVSVFKECGLFDDINFPHYGADMDFCFKMREAGYSLCVEPTAHVYLDVSHSASTIPDNSSFAEKLLALKAFVIDESDRQGAHMLWKFYRKHLTEIEIVPTYLYAITGRIMKILLK